MTSQTGKKSRPLLGFYVLVAYVVIQFLWWSFLMFSLNNEIYTLRTELNLLKSSDPAETTLQGNTLEKKLHAKWVMILGEGTVFFVLLVSGILITRSSFKKENALSTQQKNFTLSITHELRSPLASVRLQLETLLLRDLDKKKQHYMLESALTDIDRLNGLVENILLAARIEDTNFKLHKEKTDLSELLYKHIDKAGFELRDNRILHLHISPGIVASIDRFSFPSIVLNLYENAVKYSALGSAIDIVLEEQHDQILLRIKDQGIGIGTEDKKLIFSKFYRAGNEETRSTKGTGLGLYIAKYLSEMQGATLSVKDNSPKGSVFELALTKSV
jgi:two-component system phosphate regulon sensor histidine kinase PhoR